MNAMRYVWIDLEMSGLDLRKDFILEIACCLSDTSLETIIKGPNIVVKHPSSVIESMNEWCRKHHGESGLSNTVLSSSSIPMQEAEEQVLAFIKKHIPGKGIGLLAGNSVHADKEFLRKDMPSILDHLHYRIIDTSTIKELCKSWNPEIYAQVPPKIGKHRALDDILESIQELTYYKSNFFNINK